MKDSSTALESIQGHRHQASFYPTGHADIHLADIVFFNIRDTVQEHRPQTFKNLYLGVLYHDSLFGWQMVADLFVQMVSHGNMGNQSQKNKHLPPCAIATYQPIKPMTDEKYHLQNMATITCILFASTPTTSNCGEVNSLVLDTLLSTRESSAAYVNLLVFLA
ncbi:hypothetical protein DSO57_1000576 [Entomophthora muscae]|uniref:Uncharacterized protein n=1 Tax=Entomophthora muscae TaxID=34485 RepID=A0ACC2SB44_9FUNG|nr:hypothetical protein DSO57_1000576 [Entomophthora muscae]